MRRIGAGISVFMVVLPPRCSTHVGRVQWVGQQSPGILMFFRVNGYFALLRWLRFLFAFARNEHIGETRDIQDGILSSGFGPIGDPCGLPGCGQLELVLA